jgi:acyl-CoA thioesterase
MGDVAGDTAVEGEAGHYRAALSPDWEIWGPNGGYVAAVALRAAGVHCGRARPVSLLCHFLDAGAFDEVDLHVETLRASKRAESVRVSMTQGGTRLLEALVWAADDELSGLEHDDAPGPAVAPPEEVVPIGDRIRLGSDRPPFSFFDNFDERPLDWVDDWDHRPAGDPVHRCWYRFLGTEHDDADGGAEEDDAWVRGGELAILVDTFQWPAAVRGHAGGTVEYMAPSLDLACRFHRRPAPADWYLVEARSPVATGGLVAGVASVWDRHGSLLASGGQQMLCRPAPGSG